MGISGLWRGSIKKIITSYGFINSIKWNGEWFNDEKKTFSRIILPNLFGNDASIDSVALDTFSLDNCIFMKNHKEGVYCFDSASLVMKLDHIFLKLIIQEYNQLGLLWAYQDGEFAFIKYFTLKEVSKLSRN